MFREKEYRRVGFVELDQKSREAKAVERGGC